MAVFPLSLNARVEETEQVVETKLQFDHSDHEKILVYQFSAPVLLGQRSLFHLEVWSIGKNILYPAEQRNRPWISQVYLKSNMKHKFCLFPITASQTGPLSF